MLSPAGLPPRFEVVRQVGAGGMGIVYEARDLERNLRVAIKTLQKADSRLLYLLKQEFRSLADIAHPNLVALHELVSDGDAWFLVMEFLDGIDMIRYVRDGGLAEPRVTLEADAATQTILAPTVEVSSSELIAPRADSSTEPQEPPLHDQEQFERLRASVLQLVAGVSALHRAGKLHRDIKPGNVMIARDGRAALLDFGLAADVRGSLHDGALESTTAGTFVYMSPEQAMGLKLSEASDWYSLGVMIYETIAGRLPFWGSRAEVQRARVSQDPAPVSYWAPATPADLAAVCSGLLHPLPEQRLRPEELVRLLKGDAGTTTAVQAHAFIGRERQLQELKSAFAETTHGRTVAAYVRGPSGMGKSELVNHFLGDLQRLSGTMVLRGRCYEREAVPFKAVDSLMDALARRLGRLPVEELGGFLAPNAGALGRIFPVLEPIVQSCGLAGPAGMDRQELRLAAFASLRETLRRLAKQFRLVLYVDDLQWGDADSAALLSELLRQPNAPPMLLLGSYRSEYGDSPCVRVLLAEGTVRSAEARVIDVGALDAGEARELALSILGPSAGSGELAERIALEASGHPYLVAELASTAQSTSTGAPDPAGISLDGVLWSRVAALPEKSRRLLEFISVCGHPLRQGDAYQAAGLAERDPVVVSFLRSSRLVRGSGPADQDVIEPYHDRVRETVVDHIGRQELPRFHLRLAEVFEASDHADEEALAFHFEAGGIAGKAGHYYSLAGDRAAAAVAFDRSVQLYRRALELLPPADSAGRELPAKYADALANAGRGTEAADAFLELARVGQGEAEFEYRRKAAYYYCASGRVKQGISAFRDVLARVGLRLPSTRTGALLSVLAEQARLRMRGLRFRERAEAEIPRKVLQRMDAAWSAGASVATIDTFSGLSLLSRFLRLSLDAGETYRIARALGFQAGGLATTDLRGRERGVEMLRIMESLVRPDSRPELRAHCRMTAAMVAYGHVRWKEALDGFREAEEMFSRECTGVAWELATCRMFSIWTLYSLGEFGEMGRLSARWITGARERGDLFTMTNIAGYGEPLALLASDRPDAARAAVKSALAAWPDDRYYLQSFLGTLVSGLIELYDDRPQAAWDRIQADWKRMQRSLVLRADINRIYFRDMQIQAALGVAAQSGRSDMIRFAEVETAKQERETLPCAPALAMNCRASLAALRGDRERAMALLREAIPRHDELDMFPVSNMGRRHLGKMLANDEGRELIAQSNAYFQRVEIVRPGRMSRMHFNGFPRTKGATPSQPL